jgi:hypothetical protein
MKLRGMQNYEKHSSYMNTRAPGKNEMQGTRAPFTFASACWDTFPFPALANYGLGCVGTNSATRMRIQ